MATRILTLLLVLSGFSGPAFGDEIPDAALANANLPMVTGQVAKAALGPDADALLSPTAWISSSHTSTNVMRG